MSGTSSPEEEDGAWRFLRYFDDPALVAGYAEGPKRFVPGIDALHRMTAVLLAERAPAKANVLVLGAGGGLELRALAEAQPGWRFTGVDPAGEMLALAERTLGPLSTRVELVRGYVDDAPAGPFDAGVCLLTLHFLAPDERRRTAEALRRRLRTGAPFVAAHGSFPQAPAEERALWLERYRAFAVASGADPQQAEDARAAVDAAANMLSPEADEAILRDAGFRDVRPFWSAFTWRGWIGYA